MKCFRKPILIVVGFFWVIGVIVAGFYIVQKRQTTETQADTSFCTQQGYISLGVGEVCPPGSEGITVDIPATATNNDVQQAQVQCCKVTIDSQAPQGAPSEQPGSTQQASEVAESNQPTNQPSDLTSSAGGALDNSGNSCPTIPNLSVSVTCLNCINEQ